MGPILFDVFFNLDPGLEDTLSQFAEDTELGRAAASLEGGKALQRDLNRLEGCALAAT